MIIIAPIAPTDLLWKSDETCVMTDDEVVSFLQSRSQQIRNGEEFKVVTTEGSERWRLICYPKFSAQNFFPTACLLRCE